MFGNLCRMVRFGPALYRSARRVKHGRWAALMIVLFPVLLAGCDIGGPAFSAADPADAGGAVDAADAPEASDDALTPDDGPWSCNPAKGFFECGSAGDTISIGDVCAVQADGGLFGHVRTPAVCGCAPTCACVLAAVNPCAGNVTPEYPVSCDVKGGNMFVTCSVH